MKYIVLFICLLIVCVVTKCNQYSTKETCINNCWCMWRSGSWKYPDACISPKEECGYGTGGNCWDNEGAICYVADALILLIQTGLFLSALGCSLLLAFGVIIIILWAIGKVFDEMKRRELEHWITYGMIAVAVLCMVVILFITLRVAFHFINMLYESTF